MFRFGGMLAPWVELLGKHYHPYIPAVVFGTNAVVAGLAAVLLPDTQHRELPYTIEQAETLELRGPFRIHRSQHRTQK